MINADRNWEQEKRDLTEEVLAEVRDFYLFTHEPEHSNAISLAIFKVMGLPKGHSRDNAVELILGETDPEQPRRALELDNVLSKLHYCTITYLWHGRPNFRGIAPVITEEGDLTTERVYEEAEPVLQEMYVRSHDLTTQLGDWLIGLDLLDVPYTDEQLHSRGMTIFPFPLMPEQDFQVIRLPGEPEA